MIATLDRSAGRAAGVGHPELPVDGSTLQDIDDDRCVEEANMVAGTSCCGTVSGDALTEAAAEELASVFKVLADPSRLRLLSLIATAPTGEACACDLIEPVGRSQPTVSHHLAQLVEAGLIERDKRGKWAWYRVVPDRLRAVRDALDPDGAPAADAPPRRRRVPVAVRS
jgi:ArsR family transcriptional regulator